MYVDSHYASVLTMSSKCMAFLKSGFGRKCLRWSYYLCTVPSLHMHYVVLWMTAEHCQTPCSLEDKIQAYRVKAQKWDYSQHATTVDINTTTWTSNGNDWVLQNFTAIFIASGRSKQADLVISTADFCIMVRQQHREYIYIAVLQIMPAHFIASAHSIRKTCSTSGTLAQRTILLART